MAARRTCRGSRAGRTRFLNDTHRRAAPTHPRHRRGHALGLDRTERGISHHAAMIQPREPSATPARPMPDRRAPGCTAALHSSGLHRRRASRACRALLGCFKNPVLRGRESEEGAEQLHPALALRRRARVPSLRRGIRSPGASVGPDPFGEHPTTKIPGVPFFVAMLAALSRGMADKLNIIRSMKTSQPEHFLAISHRAARQYPDTSAGFTAAHTSAACLSQTIGQLDSPIPRFHPAQIPSPAGTNSNPSRRGNWAGGGWARNIRPCASAAITRSSSMPPRETIPQHRPRIARDDCANS